MLQIEVEPTSEVRRLLCLMGLGFKDTLGHICWEMETFPICAVELLIIKLKARHPCPHPVERDPPGLRVWNSMRFLGCAKNAVEAKEGRGKMRTEFLKGVVNPVGSINGPSHQWVWEC